MDKIKFKEVKGPLNLDYNIKQSKKAQNIITKEYNPRVTKTIENYLSAVVLAENRQRPLRTDLLEIYRSVMLDSTVTAGLEQRMNKSLAQDYVISKAEERDDDLKEIFNGEWFRDFMYYTIESKFWGYSVIQFDDIKDSKITGVENIDRFYVIPERKEIKTHRYDIKGVPIEKFDALFIGKKYDLGLLHKIAYYVLYKKHALSNYNEYVELFGQPTRVAKITASEDPDDVMEMMRNMGASLSAVVNHNTDIEFVSANGAGNTVFDALIKYLDDQINLLINQTKDSEENYAQANKDERLENSSAYMDNIYIQDVVNDKLIPFLIDLGFKELEGATFKFNYKTDLDVMTQFEIDSKISQLGFKVDPEYLMEKYGTKILEPEEPVVEQVNEEETKKKKEDFNELKNRYYGAKNNI